MNKVRSDLDERKGRNGTKGLIFECLNVRMLEWGVGDLESLEGKDVHPRVELLVRGKKSFGHVKIDAKRVSDSVVLCTVVDLHKREEL